MQAKRRQAAKQKKYAGKTQFQESLSTTFLQLIGDLRELTSSPRWQPTLKVYDRQSLQLAIQKDILSQFISHGQKTWLTPDARDVRLFDNFVPGVLQAFTGMLGSCNPHVVLEMIRILAMLTSEENNSESSAFYTCAQFLIKPQVLAGFVLSVFAQEELDVLSRVCVNDHECSWAEHGELLAVVLELLANLSTMLASDECPNMVRKTPSAATLAQFLDAEGIALDIATCVSQQKFVHLDARTHSWSVLAGGARASSALRLRMFETVANRIESLAATVEPGGPATDLETHFDHLSASTIELRAASEFIADLTRASCRDGGWTYTDTEVSTKKGIPHSVKPSPSVYRSLMEHGVTATLHQLCQSCDAVVLEHALRALSDMARVEICREQLWQAPCGKSMYCEILAQCPHSDCVSHCALLLSHLTWSEQWKHHLCNESCGPRLLRAAKQWLEWSRPCRRKKRELHSEKFQAEAEVASRFLIMLGMLAIPSCASWPEHLLASGVVDAVIPFIDVPIGPHEVQRYDQQKGALVFLQNAFVSNNFSVARFVESVKICSPKELLLKLFVHVTAGRALASLQFQGNSQDPLLNFMAASSPGDGGMSKVLLDLARAVFEYLLEDRAVQIIAQDIIRDLKGKEEDDWNHSTPDHVLISGMVDRAKDKARAASTTVIEDQGAVLLANGLSVSSRGAAPKSFLDRVRCCPGRRMVAGNCHEEAHSADESEADQTRSCIRQQGDLIGVASIPDIAIQRCQFCHKLEEHRKQFAANLGAGKCSRCKAVYYCSKQCQANDWKTHKLNCKTPLVK